MLSERILQALDVLGSDEQAGGTIREQASSYLGEDVDNQSLMYLSSTARIIFDRIYEGVEGDDGEATMAALTSVILGGIAIGKRLGIEDGERFARELPDVN